MSRITVIPDKRKYRATKLYNLETNKSVIGEALLDSGAKFTIISIKKIMELNLPFIGKYQLQHSDGVIENSHIVYGAIGIRGKLFPTRMIVSNMIDIDVIIGADFMETYSMYLQFRGSTEISLKKFDKRISWNRRDL